MAAEQIYVDGTYLDRNPSWHAEDSAWKAAQCASLLTDLKLEPARVCDVGCGVGGVLGALREIYPAAEMTGFDVSTEAITRAGERHPDVRFQAGDVTGSYDLMLVMDVIEHVEDCFGFTRRLARHAELFLFHIPLDLSCLSLLRNVLMAQRSTVGHIHYFTKQTALALLDDAGYDVLSWRYTPVLDLAPSDLRSRMVTAVQRAGFRLAPDLSVLLVGGRALLVAARPRPT